MPWFRLRDGCTVHVKLGKNPSGPWPCSVCHFFAYRLCDWKLEGGKTCSAPLCTQHSFQPIDGKDLCPRHAGLAKGWLAGRTNSVDGPGPEDGAGLHSPRPGAPGADVVERSSACSNDRFKSSQ